MFMIVSLVSEKMWCNEKGFRTKNLLGSEAMEGGVL